MRMSEQERELVTLGACAKSLGSPDGDKMGHVRPHCLLEVGGVAASQLKRRRRPKRVVRGAHDDLPCRESTGHKAGATLQPHQSLTDGVCTGACPSVDAHEGVEQSRARRWGGRARAVARALLLVCRTSLLVSELRDPGATLAPGAACGRA